MAGVDEGAVLSALKKVIDPEIGISVVDLGLIYDIKIDGNDVKIKMTLTTPMCPLGPVIVDNVRKAVEGVEEVENVDVEVVFDPPWSPDMIKPEVKEKLGLGV